jgi:hypothetical protein
MNLKIERFGNGMDLFIAEITRDQLRRLEKAATFFGKFYWKKSLQNLWYLKQDKMWKIFGVSSFRQMQSGNHRYLGPVLRSKQGLDHFLEGITIYEDDRPLDVDASKIRTRFQPTPTMPTLTGTNVLVFHGEHYRGTTAWELQAEPPFNLKQLRLNFIDCGENGYILQSAAFRGKKVLGQEEAQSRGYLKPQFIVS